ncbi:hypothetical protein ASPWEDRAFT_28149 [Aspergillus wentii DTO 134E9]|uniref:Mitochondrial outer membrane transport complex Sam37/metaxin N-terminal domain-containing protein n=1 Tax=Aspergillus wentii DTO 134E9 TaxID=1073089 RepID=A0A1L9RKR5_ASPWE|nr:uncharacterized protein ASPWEDRAFT_28149 [Aspergillus wentii DTO 134E9]KAI9924713.1 hypothetical protein MW887_006565 [Aspergillus wentii]OJJ35521.1 hypothetical protein ASPWEDRAFT_28149 [Aspergillus wentii DTO 134E9]
MVLELHVWGPAFSLPSIDAQCLATITYLSLVLPKDAWVLIPSSDPSVSPTHELPALKNGATWVSRFRNIVDYLRQYSDGEWDLDAGLNTLQRADNIAFSSFVESRGQPLLDLSLYVTSRNYYANTSPAYGSILQWPNQWILPPQLHTAAKTRTDHLGLSSLDLEAIEDQRKREHSAAVAAGHVPKNFIPKPKETPTGLLGKSSQQNQFKLEALTAEFFEPLEEILNAKTYFLSEDAPSSLDCLAFGHLCLALVPDLPYSWLRDAMKAKGSQLTTYTERMRTRFFGVVDVQRALAGTSTETSPLPWQAPQRASVGKVGYTLLNTLADATPIVKDLRAQTQIREAAESPNSGLSADESQAVSNYARGQKRDVFVSIAAVAGGVAALVGYMVHVGLFSAAAAEEWTEEEEVGGVGEPEGGLDLKNLEHVDILSAAASAL